MPDAQLIRILLVDDHALVRSGLKNFIYGYEWMEPVGEASNGQEAVEFCRSNPVDVILMDMVMPVMDGVQATRQILEQNPSIKIVILTSFLEQDMVQQALRAGAIGYILKNVSADDLAKAIRSAYEGHSTLAPEATEALVQATRNQHQPGADLTEREREVLSYLAMGFSNSEISHKLSVSLATVKFHLSNIYTKLGVNNRVEAVTTALEFNLIEKP
jgi:NarL family two-component system response regulator LiaR